MSWNEVLAIIFSIQLKSSSSSKLIEIIKINTFY